MVTMLRTRTGGRVRRYQYESYNFSDCISKSPKSSDESQSVGGCPLPASTFSSYRLSERSYSTANVAKDNKRSPEVHWSAAGHEPEGHNVGELRYPQIITLRSLTH